MELNPLLRSALSYGASDLHLKAGAVPFVRAGGRLTPLPGVVRLSPEDTRRLADQVLNDQQKELFQRHKHVDVSHQVPEIGRFRVNVFRQREATSLVFRIIPQSVLSISELNLPSVTEQLCEENRGLILVTGRAGSGKSTALASMIQHMNRTRVLHILTIEDPIEFFHLDQMSFISQREVNQDADSFAAALRAGLRQDPDVIMVGEIRDTETLQTCLHAAETGHLVLSTLHTTDAAETINRILAWFPPHQERQIRAQLASVLKAIISLRLIRTLSGPERLPAAEVLINTEFIRDCIIEPERTRDIRGALVSGTTQYGMQTFDQSIFGFYNQGRISRQEALAYASNPEEFELRIRGIVSSSEAIDVG
ncbi:MAG: PilT/PilU family type 4a pilus ATPase [Acidobacteria bacterium]|nr:PilT/PilU family type 4a pilus ATPase [Acidobacteriota bacterium]